MAQAQVYNFSPKETPIVRAVVFRMVHGVNPDQSQRSPRILSSRPKRHPRNSVAIMLHQRRQRTLPIIQVSLQHRQLRRPIHTVR
jgi:hypothetical protein